MRDDQNNSFEESTNRDTTVTDTGQTPDTLGALEEEYTHLLNQLRAKQRVFVEEYLIDLNGTQAALRAGYSKKGVDKQVNRMLGNAVISQCISLALEIRSRRTGTTADRVLEELWRNYERCMQLKPVLDRQGKPIGKYKYEPAAANRALELIGQHLGMFGKVKDDKHLHLHQDKYVNCPPIPKTIKEWVEQMREIGYDASIDGEEENESNPEEIDDK